jgi:hypothetical protein
VAHMTRGDAARIDEVAALWKELHSHHARVAQHLAAVRRFRSSQVSWEIRREQYLQYLASPLPAALFLAQQDGVIVGYAIVRARGVSPGRPSLGSFAGLLAGQAGPVGADCWRYGGAAHGRAARLMRTAALEVRFVHPAVSLADRISRGLD